MQNFSLTEFKSTWEQRSIPSILTGCNLLLLATGNTIAKIAGSVFALPSSGETRINRFANKGFSSIIDAQLLLPSLFFITFRFFNPYSEGMEFIENFESRGKFIGPLTPAIAYPLFKNGIKIADNPANSQLKKHVISRCCFFTGILLLTVTKLIEISIGLFLTTLAAIFLGSSPKLNDYAMKYLSALDGLDELCSGIRILINPWTNLGQLGASWSGHKNWNYRKSTWRL